MEETRRIGRRKRGGGGGEQEDTKQIERSSYHGSGITNRIARQGFIGLVG
jgi:hypothetical protein